MKKKLLIISFIVLSFVAKAQDTIPNANFEKWSAFGSDQVPNQWSTSDVVYSEIDSLYSEYYGTFATFKDTTTVTQTTGYTGYGVKMTTRAQEMDIHIPSILGSPPFDSTAYDTLPGFIITGYGSTYRPTTFSGYYTFSPVGKDTAVILIGLTKWNSNTASEDSIGGGIYYISAAVSSYTSFNIPITYISGETPDSITIFISSSFANVPNLGTSLVVDDLTLSGGVTAISNGQTTGSITVYPNPVINQVNFSNLPANAAKVEIMDITGRPITEGNVSSSSLAMDVQTLSSGIYLYSVYSTNGSVLGTSRFVK